MPENFHYDVFLSHRSKARVFREEFEVFHDGKSEGAYSSRWVIARARYP